MITAQRLQTLSQLYQIGQVSELMERTLHKLFSYETEVSRQQLIQLQTDLAEFESQYNMPSAHFYARFQSGEMGDAMDYIEWASLFQMTRNLQQRLQILTTAAAQNTAGAD